MEVLFPYKDVLLMLLKNYLFNHDGLALALTCKRIYELTTPVFRLQLRAGLSFAPLPTEFPMLVKRRDYVAFKQALRGEHLQGQWHTCPDCNARLKCKLKRECNGKGCSTMTAHTRHKCQVYNRYSRKDVCSQCETCGHARFQHSNAHLLRIFNDIETMRPCPLEKVLCAAKSCNGGTVQQSTPWTVTRSLNKCTCTQCKVPLDFYRGFSSESSCALCGIYCFECRLRTCVGCNQQHRDKNHVCAAYIDRLLLRLSHARGMCWENTRYEDAPVVVSETIVTAKCKRLGQLNRWVLVPSREQIPPIEYDPTDVLFIVHQESTECLVHYAGNAGLVGLFQDHASRDVKRAWPMCARCFCTDHARGLKCVSCKAPYCSQACFVKDAKRHAPMCKLAKSILNSFTL